MLTNMLVKALAVCTLAIALAGALESPPPSESVTPEFFSQLDDHVESEQREFSLAQTNMEKKGPNACAKMANAAKASVRKDAKNLQDQLDSFNKDRNCVKKGQSAVKQARRELADAKQKVRETDKSYLKARDTPINFGIHKFSSVKKGHCNTFFSSYNYKKVETKVQNSKKKFTAAKTRLANAKKGLETALENAKRLRNKCYCKARKAFDLLYRNLSRRLVEGQTKAWKRAFYLLCVLKGTPQKTCPVAALPKLRKNMGILTEKARKARCDSGNYIGQGRNSMIPNWASNGQAKSQGDKICANKYGNGAYWCSRKDILHLAKKLPQNSWIPVSDFLHGKRNTYYNGMFLCSNAKNGVWKGPSAGPANVRIDQAWSFRCNGQTPPCCRRQ
jgi:hypothetical protein